MVLSQGNRSGRLRQVVAATAAAVALLLGSSTARAVADTPAQHPRSIAICAPVMHPWGYSDHDAYWVDLSPATGKAYRGATSILVYYHSNLIGFASCHFIIRGDNVLHGPHIKLGDSAPQ